MQAKLFEQRVLTTFASAAALFCVLPATSHAQETSFDGGTSNPGDWSDAANWSGDTAPTGTQTRVGDVAGAIFTANFTSGSDTVAGLRVGQATGGTGTATGVVNMSSGTLETTDWSFVGVDGTADNNTNGTLNLSGDAVFGSSGNTNVHIGLGGGGGGQYNQGLLTIADNASLRANAFVVGSNDSSVGVVNQTGGSITSDNWVNVGQESGADGTYNMSGGSLTAPEMSVGQNGGATGVMNFSGTATIDITGGDTNALRIGRDEGGTGTFNIVGSTGQINTTGFTVGGNIGAGTAANGTLSFTSDSGGVTPIVTSGDVFLNDGSASGSSTLIVDLETEPVDGDVLLIDVGGAAVGTFTGLAEGDAVPGSGGRMITYSFGDGNDIGLTLIPEPSSLVLMLGGLLLVGRRRR